MSHSISALIPADGFDRRLLDLQQFVLREIVELVAIPEDLLRKGEQHGKEEDKDLVRDHDNQRGSEDQDR
jgi:hypothetical protein